MTIPEDIRDFMSRVADGGIEIYNEFSLQHEFGIYLREKYPSKKVQYERNVTYFGLTKHQFTKREIDIAVFDHGFSTPDVAIELKYPRNGQYPEQLLDCCANEWLDERLNRLGGYE